MFPCCFIVVVVFLNQLVPELLELYPDAMILHTSGHHSLPLIKTANVNAILEFLEKQPSQPPSFPDPWAHPCGLIQMTAYGFHTSL